MSGRKHNLTRFEGGNHLEGAEVAVFILLVLLFAATLALLSFATAEAGGIPANSFNMFY
ncbi:hypothetical protein STSP1_00775 [Sedimentisphaera salicampi]|uniref:Uncharacterized protein n=2 Tax=Sedimentisphaera salicampi TaxID=1941349 RepID=A0A1W6LKZ3_9BACT|nr:hypothetical protein STSP1_00775 [Sedimentisphaera salicampi]OXU15280.1 hypothetical protein SMSP1_00759 [Sedimentisphaera salicampi]